MTRMQYERTSTVEEQDVMAGYGFNLTPTLVDTMKKDAIIMHPLPRGPEIPQSVDDNHRAVYFQQAKFGVPTRMALITKALK